MATINNIVLKQWTILAAADGLPLTGMTAPADVSLPLFRQSGSTMIAAVETVSMVEIGVTGDYYISFTPLNTGLYTLQINETDAATMQRRYAQEFVVVSAGAAFAPSYSDAFCAETDIERWLQQAISATSEPNDSEATAFAVGRAAALMSLCARLGSAVTPATVTTGSRLQSLLREANAIGAAADYSVAQAFQKGTSISERTEQFLGQWIEYHGGPMPGFVTARVGLVELEIRGNLASLATSHVLSGDTTARAAENAPQDIGLQVRMGDVY